METCTVSQPQGLSNEELKIFEEKQTLSIETMFKSLFIIVRQGEGIYYLAPSRNIVDANVHR